ncbi:MAG: ArsR/SmtB family transcription factor [Thermomicrobiales bacterium]
MTDRPSPPGDGAQVLRFACTCTSAAPVAEDPWVAISQQHKLNNGTKELILNALYRQPRTTAQLAQVLRLSAPAVHRHVAELRASELIREVAVPEGGRRSALERFYRPNFPVVLAADQAALQPTLDELADAFAGLFRDGQASLAEAFQRTSLPAREETFEALLHYLFAAATRMARARLEAAGDLPPWPEHDDGSRWVWWAEEPPETEVG